uniref:DUF1639 family protein n=1 Tax=Anthurium amnicola TaxID=1678845 RepID=A0A1D1Y2Y0_9ARAE
MPFPGDGGPRAAVEVITAAAAAASSSSPSPPTHHRPLLLRGKPRSRPPISPLRPAWANQRLLRCVRVDGAGDGPRTVPSEPGPTTAGAGDDGFERIRAKLMDHLRAAVGRIELPAVPAGEARWNHPAGALVMGGDDGDGGGREEASPPSPSSSPESAAGGPPESPISPAPAPAAPAADDLPWNLRTRRSAASCNGRQHPAPGPSSPAPSPPARPPSRLRSVGAPERREPGLRRRRPRFSVPLTKEEIDEDLYAFTGRRASRRPKKRPRAVQKQLDMLFPGLWLSEVTADAYQVADPPPPPS